jgi:hypothetical protein
VLSALKQNLGSHKFKDDCEVKAVVTKWLITQDTNFNREQKSLLYSMMSQMQQGLCGKAVGHHYNYV